MYMFACMHLCMCVCVYICIYHFLGSTDRDWCITSTPCHSLAQHCMMLTRHATPQKAFLPLPYCMSLRYQAIPAPSNPNTTKTDKTLLLFLGIFVTSSGVTISGCTKSVVSLSAWSSFSVTRDGVNLKPSPKHARYSGLSAILALIQLLSLLN